MQPFTPEFARAELGTAPTEIVVGGSRYSFEVGEDGAWLHERGPGGVKEYAIEHALGGKNIYYFLTPRERGRLQVVPLAYDVRLQEWFEATASMVRHFTGSEDAALEWTDPLLTFNTSCYGCHVSQLSTHYDIRTDSYRTVWAEPGVNCETCHGPAEEHIRVFREAAEGAPPEDPRIISASSFTVKQMNESCAVCHAKMYSITNTFQPGDRYFDHFGLTTLEHPDFYPDGRDLGENYTYTQWLRSPCIASGELDCLHCHTTSGRYRFEDDPNQACAPCHLDKLENPSGHTRHAAESEGSECVACHMPSTEFARMVRSDHSMRPPTPAATIEFGSPNACNLCHADRDAVWADNQVREWRDRDYQAPVLRRARLIDAARKGEWTRLSEMLDGLADPAVNQVYKSGLSQLLSAADDARKWPALLKALEDPSPLVRASAAQALSDHFTPESTRLLLEATRDDYRLVRVSAAAALAGVPSEDVPSTDRDGLEQAVLEYVAAMETRPDSWNAHYNLGNFYLRRGEPHRAIASFERAHKLEPRATAPLINAAIVYGLLGEEARAEESLLRALEVEPDNTAANLNLGLLLSGQERTREAEAAFRVVMSGEPHSVAAYNLCVITASDRIDEAIEWCRKAVELQPNEPEYAYTLAYFERDAGEADSAVARLQALVGTHPGYTDGYLLLGDILEGQGRLDEAEALYRRALSGEAIPARERGALEERVKELGSSRAGGD
jgi:tetratricopeptide (TPR) repeat protein